MGPMGGLSSSSRRRCRMAAAEDRRCRHTAFVGRLVVLLLRVLLLLCRSTTAASTSKATFIISQNTGNAHLQRRKALNRMPSSFALPRTTTKTKRSVSSMGRQSKRSFVQVDEDQASPPSDYKDDDAINHYYHDQLSCSSRKGVSYYADVSSRSEFLAWTLKSASAAAFGLFLAAANNVVCVEPAGAFEGGIGGLGKTKPQTGVLLWDEDFAPLQNSAGVVTAELNVAGQPVFVTFQAPWPLLPTTAGLEARDLLNSESAFVQVVVSNNSNDPTTKQGMLQFLLDSVLSQQGKFGAYGAPIDVKVKQLSVATNDETQQTIVTCIVPFTTYTPGLRESERQLLVRAVSLGGTSKNKSSNSNTWILWIVGTTRQRFAAQEPVLQQVLDSFQAVPAPASNRSSRSN